MTLAASEGGEASWRPHDAATRRCAHGPDMAVRNPEQVGRDVHADRVEERSCKLRISVVSPNIRTAVNLREEARDTALARVESVVERDDATVGSQELGRALKGSGRCVVVEVVQEREHDDPVVGAGKLAHRHTRPLDDGLAPALEPFAHLAYVARIRLQGGIRDVPEHVAKRRRARAHIQHAHARREVQEPRHKLPVDAGRPERPLQDRVRHGRFEDPVETPCAAQSTPRDPNHPPIPRTSVTTPEAGAAIGGFRVQRTDRSWQPLRRRVRPQPSGADAASGGDERTRPAHRSRAFMWRGAWQDPGPVTEPDPTTLSVVVPNLDGARWLEGCLASIAAGERQPLEVVVSDDGSTDDSAAVADRYGASFVESPKSRTGFAATANRGIRVAKGDVILLLNNDTELAPTAVGAILDGCRRYPDTAMFAPLVLSLRNRTTIDSAGMLLYRDATARPRWHGRSLETIAVHEEEVLVPSGAAAAFRRTWLDRVGLLDEGMISYLEDIDLGLRIRRHGGRAVFLPESVVFHWFSGTTGALSPTKARLIERNHMIVAARHIPIPWLVALPLWTALRWVTMARTILSGPRIGTGEPTASVPATAVAVIRGTVEGLARLPSGLRDRHRITDGAAVCGLRWRRLLGAHRARLSDYAQFGATPPAKHIPPDVTPPDSIVRP